jgi:hypothetical protein
MPEVSIGSKTNLPKYNFSGDLWDTSDLQSPTGRKCPKTPASSNLLALLVFDMLPNITHNPKIH